MVVILGYPGTGKLTVARELVNQLSAEADGPVRLIDNHAVADLLFPLIAEADGKTPLPAGIFRRTREVNLSALKTIDELSPKNWSFVFTHHLIDSEDNRRYLDLIEDTARRRGSKFVTVLLTCDVAVLVDRVTRPDREGRKLTDPSAALDIIEHGLLQPDGALVLDISDLAPGEAAGQILTAVAVNDGPSRGPTGSEPGFPQATQVLQAMIDMFASGDPSTAETVVAPDYVDHQGLGAGSILGVAGFARVVRLNYASIRGQQIDVVDMFGLDDRAVARIRWRGVRADGEKVDRQTIDIIRVERGLAIEHWGAQV